jgi:hypothetical protein
MSGYDQEKRVNVAIKFQDEIPGGPEGHGHPGPGPRSTKIPLIKFVRTVTGWGLKDSKTFVEAMLWNDGPYEGPIWREVEMSMAQFGVFEAHRLSDDILMEAVDLTDILIVGAPRGVDFSSDTFIPPKG